MKLKVFLLLFQVQYSFAGEVRNSWSVSGGTRFSGLCVFAVGKTRKPKSEDIVIDMGTSVTQFEVNILIFITTYSGLRVYTLSWNHDPPTLCIQLAQVYTWTSLGSQSS